MFEIGRIQKMQSHTPERPSDLISSSHQMLCEIDYEGHHLENTEYIIVLII